MIWNGEKAAFRNQVKWNKIIKKWKLSLFNFVEDQKENSERYECDIKVPCCLTILEFCFCNMNFTCFLNYYFFCLYISFAIIIEAHKYRWWWRNTCQCFCNLLCFTYTMFAVLTWIACNGNLISMILQVNKVSRGTVLLWGNAYVLWGNAYVLQANASFLMERKIIFENIYLSYNLSPALVSTLDG